MGTTSEGRKRHEAAMLREAERLGLTDRIWTALRRVYGDAEHAEAVALRDALEDEQVIS